MSSVPLVRRLPGPDRRELLAHLNVFLEEKHFEGCDGFHITDEVREVIAAQACVLLLHRRTAYFPAMRSVMVYPDEFEVNVSEQENEWLVTEYREDRSGESWDYGPIVLSWQDVEDSARPENAGYNVVLHEFAHQLDLESGEIDGMPKLANRTARDRWRTVFSAAYGHHTREVEANRQTPIDDYAADSPHEFFAVSVEAFFETPEVLAETYPDVYTLLSSYFAQDPREWGSGASSRGG